MAKKPYPNAPIVEALLDIQVLLKDDFKFETLKCFEAKLKKRFPESQVTREISANFEAKESEEPTVQQSVKDVGLMLRNPDQGKILQVRMNGYSFSKLQPYKNWEEFSKEAFDLWNLYISIVEPIAITRLALRYINRINIPKTLSTFEEYVTTVPIIGEDLPQGLNEMFMRVVIPKPDGSANAIISETIDLANITDKIVPLIFDIDVYKEVNLKGDSKAVEGIFNDLREYKNQLFEGSITDKARSLFK